MENTKTRLEAATLFLVVFVLGVIFGALGNHVWSQRVAGEQAAINTKPNRDQVMQDLTQRLQLTPEQQTQIGAAIDETRARWQALYAPLDAPREQIRQEGRAKIRATLTPEQQVKFDDFLKRLDEQRKKEAAEKQQQQTH
jgi:Spy/CpxP family protein refolding chaperone